MCVDFFSLKQNQNLSILPIILKRALKASGDAYLP
jgi:hypothetical protein